MFAFYPLDMKAKFCSHKSCNGTPSHDDNCYTTQDLCLNCISCFSKTHPGAVFPSVVAFRSSNDDESYLCLECYTDFICTIFEWNYRKKPTEEMKGIVQAIRNFNGSIPPEDAKFLLPDIAGTLHETPFIIGQNVPDTYDLNILQKLDSIISWNSVQDLVNPNRSNVDFLLWRYSQSLSDWNNFLNQNRTLDTFTEYEKLPIAMIKNAEMRMLTLQVL